MEAAQELAFYIESNQERFYRIAYTYVKNREDALDIVHNAIVKALQSYGTLRNPAYAHTWFYRILVNESVSFLRKNRRTLSLEALSMPPSEDGLSGREESIDQYAAVDKLPPDAKTLVILRFFEEMKLTDIAAITSTNLNTLKSRLRRVLAQLKVDMEVMSHD